MANISNLEKPVPAFLAGGGEMGQLIRSIDWETTALGHPENWPAALKQTVSMMQTTTFPVLICWGADYIQLYNDAFRPILGATKHPQAMGISASETYAEIWDTIGPMFAGVMGGQAVGFPGFMVPLDRNGYMEDCYFDFSYSPIKDIDGDIGGVLVICMETTDKVRAINNLEANQKNIERMIAQAPVGMCILLGPNHVISIANEIIIELWGKPAEDVMYKPVFEALPDARDQGLEEVMANVYHTGEAFRASEMPVSLLRNGRQDVVYQNFVYEPYRDVDGSILGILAITIDVTEQVLARQNIENSEAELLSIKKQLEQELETGKQIQRQKDGFIGIASHELKTPLTSLTAIVQVLGSKLRTSEDPFVSGALDKAGIQVKKMNNLINGFLNISRFESGKMLMTKEVFDLEKLITETIEEIRLLSPAHNVYFHDCESIYINADHDKIGSVVSNLLSNAVKYSPKGKNIEVTCKIIGNNVRVSIKDEGMGIKPQDMPQLFERYYRVETKHTAHISGFGIGLYLSAEIIRRHDGKIWAESESGMGSTFYFSLPIEV
jgi:two-component system sensor histidine kinase VicK